MKKWLRNIALGMGIAAVGAGYTHKAYEDYQNKELISNEQLYNGFVTIGTVRSKSNIVFDLFEIMHGDHDRETYTTNFAGFQNVKIEVQPIEEKARKIRRNWGDYVANSRMKKGDPNWNASNQAIYNFFNGSLSNLEKNYVAEKIKDFRDHELDHVEKYRSNTKYSKEQSELRAYLSSLSNSSSAMEEILWAADSGKPEHQYAGKEIIAQLKRYSDTPDLYSICHHPDFNTEMPKRAKEIKEKLFGNHK